MDKNETDLQKLQQLSQRESFKKITLKLIKQ